MIEQDSCLHGGTRFCTLIKKGNGMEEKWATHNALLPDGSFDIGAPDVQTILGGAAGAEAPSWDFVVMNDYTQGPADVL